MASDIVERIIILCYSPPWPVVGVALTVITAVVTIPMVIFSFNLEVIMLSTIIIPGLFGGFAMVLSQVVPYRKTGIEITCIQNQPQNSVENHHKSRYKINAGIGHLKAYVDIPDWVTKFEIKVEKNSDIEMIPFDNKPNSVRFENNVLKSDQKLDGFPIKLKLSGEPDELAEGEYILEFVDLRTKNTIQKMTLKCDPEPPDSINENKLGDDEIREIDQWL